MSSINFNPSEIQSGWDRIQWAESLILQLPKHHEGRNSWLLNFGVSNEAKSLRHIHGVNWVEETQSASISKEV